MDVSVIIPVYNDAARLALCLRALAHQRYPADRFEVIVVDNGSSPPMDHVAAAPHLRVLIANEPGRGSYAARNRGIELASGAVIAFTDADCIPDPDWIQKGVATFSATANCGLAAGRIELFYGDPERPTAAELYERVSGFPQEQYVNEFHYGATANLFTSADVLRSVGPFDMTLTSGGDVEWGKRVHAAGYVQVYAPDVVVKHPARATLRALVNKRRRTASGVVRAMRDRHLRFGRAHWARRVFRLVAERIVPPRTELAALWHDQRLNGASERVKVVAIGCVLNYAFAYEFVRLALGGVPKR
jgi:glycosyltransferase involved in cell wall biosynthesis